MFEELFAFALLLDVGFVSYTEYGEHLDALFVEAPENDLLLELEWNYSNAKKSIAIIREHCNECNIDYDVFGRFLFKKMNEIFTNNKMDIQDFAAKAYAIWKQLPSVIDQTEPFGTLSYADDPLSWGDEKQTRELYEKAFRFYNNIQRL